jgi:hypothetical protein
MIYLRSPINNFQGIAIVIPNNIQKYLPTYFVAYTVLFQILFIYDSLYQIL